MSNAAVGDLLRGRQGFTLLEILVAMAVLAVAFPILLANVSQDIALATEGKFLVTASLLAQEKMAELTAGEPPAAGSLQGGFGEDFPGYSWQLDVRDADLPETRHGGVALRRLDLKIEGRFAKAYRYALRRYLLVAGGR